MIISMGGISANLETRGAHCKIPAPTATMDVPAWHPANEDAAARRAREQAGDAAAKRVEFKVMAGSSADTSTEAGRELLSDLRGDGGGAAWTGRGFFDASDRLYLLEQKRLRDEGERREEQRRVAELRSFRSTALKLQALKAPAAVQAAAVAVAGVPLAPTAHKKAQATPVVVVKPKKRPAAGGDGAAASKKSRKEAKAKPKQQSATMDTKTQAKPAAGKRESEPKAPAPAPTPAPTAALVVGYSSSSDSDA